MEDETNVRPSGIKSLLLHMAHHWKGLVIILIPIIFLPILVCNFDRKEYRCMYILLTMAIYWITEALPLPVTSMIPIVAFPLAGIMDSETTCQLYFKDTLVMFMGGIMVAMTIEYSNLHQRVALRVLKFVGCSPKRLLFGLILVTMFISFWISNSASTAMMCPIIQAILQELDAQGLCKMYDEKQTNVEKKGDELPFPSKIATCFYLGAAYASSIGGCATLIGTATNLTLKGIYEGRFENATDVINFPSFMFYSVPPVLVNTFFTFLWMAWLHMGLWRPNSKDAQIADIGPVGAEIAKGVIDDRYNLLGRMKYHEINVLILFIILVILYFTRKPGIFTGWADVLNDVAIKNSAPTMFIIILCFMLPSSLIFLKNWSKDQRETPSIVAWKFMQQKVPWGLIFLVGGGFVLAEGTSRSGMAKMVGNSLADLKGLPLPVLLFIIILAAEILTEFSSNVAIANILLPVLLEVSITIEVHPLYLMLPAALACSMAFHLPVGTPPNALVSGYANIKTKDMAIAGIGPSVITIVFLFIFCQTWGLVVYPGLTSFPDWAAPNNTVEEQSYIK